MVCGLMIGVLGGSALGLGECVQGQAGVTVLGDANN